MMCMNYGCSNIPEDNEDWDCAFCQACWFLEHIRLSSFNWKWPKSPEFRYLPIHYTQVKVPRINDPLSIINTLNDLRTAGNRQMGKARFVS